MTEEEKIKFIEELESWKGTKWMHGVALKGYASDCAHFIMEVAKFMGWVDKAYELPLYTQTYSLHANTHPVFNSEVEKFFYRIKEEDREMGDLLEYKWGRTTGHFGLYLSDNRFIHCLFGVGVVGDSYKQFRRNLLGVWRFKKKWVM